MKQSITKQTSLQTLALPLLLAAAFLLLTAPTWRWLWGEWMGNEYYAHGVLIPFVSTFLIVQRIRNDKRFAWTPGEGTGPALLLTAAAVAAYLWFVHQRAFYLASFALIALLAGLLWLMGGTKALRALLFPIAYLAFMVPLPLIDRITLPLALFTGVCSGGLARFLGLDVTITGNAVTLPNADLVIGAQCSGVNSLITLTALLALVTYLVDGPLWSRIGLVLLAVPLALLGNILRVTSLLFVAKAWGADAAFVFYHDYSGIGFFVLVLLLLYPLTRLLRLNELRLHVI